MIGKAEQLQVLNRGRNCLVEGVHHHDHTVPTGCFCAHLIYYVRRLTQCVVVLRVVAGIPVIFLGDHPCPYCLFSFFPIPVAVPTADCG